MNVSPATVAIVGSGELARAHARVAVAHPDLLLVALVGADERAATALADEVVQQFEGERPRRFSDLGSALHAAPIDIVAMGDMDDVDDASAVAVRAGAAVVGGPVPAGSAGPGRWFPFEIGRSPGGSAHDAAFADHLRQYEGILGRIGFGPLADRVGVRA